MGFRTNVSNIYDRDESLGMDPKCLKYIAHPKLKDLNKIANPKPRAVKI